MSEIFNEGDVRQFYRWLGHRPDEYTEVRIIKWPPLGPVIQRWVQTEDDFVNVCRKWSGKRQVYVGLNPRRARAVGEGKSFNCPEVGLDDR